jgi:uncharacterized protein GlcG (DUF336 family)
MNLFSKTTLCALAALTPAPMWAECKDLPGFDKLKPALDQAVAAESTGLKLHMWATIVDRDGIVCAIAMSGFDRGAQWPGSRVISAQKANTANAFSLDGLALSTANLYAPTQPGASLYGLQESNPVDTGVAYKGPAAKFGTKADPMVGGRVGGVNVFGGGFGLYNASRKVVGGIGVSGDTSCRDHRIGWRVRNTLGLDNVLTVQGVSGDTQRPDNMVFDITDNPNGGTGKSAGGFGHPHCLGAATDGVPSTLPAVK